MRILLPVLMILAFMAAPTLAQPPGDGPIVFVEGVDDLPLMPGLSPVADGTLIFDKPGGRIVSALAMGPVDTQDVTAFYANTLPQLGWTARGSEGYVREDERLVLDYIPVSSGLLMIQFRITPR
ncbi:MAG: hypothetical protein U9N14_02740 [Pseudomonadota bacterium]|nr:hypothetical protein [Pseudomonadota bacterium]